MLDFLPIVTGLDGFLGYLWFPVEAGFAAITPSDSEAPAEASNEAARVPHRVHRNPEISGANIVYANLPVPG